MIKKTYRARALTEAVRRIRGEMGQQAVILESRQIPARKTFFKEYPAELEVTAGIEERHLTQQQIDLITVPHAGRPKSRGGALASLSTVASRILERGEAAGTVTVARPPAGSEILKPLREKLRAMEEENRRLKSDLENLRDGPPEPEEKSASPPGEPDDLWPVNKTSIPDSRPPHLRTSAPPHHITPSPEITAELSQWREYLAAYGVSEGLLIRWEDFLKGRGLSSPEGILDESIAFFMEVFRPAEGAIPKITAFVGPEGAGKTSAVMGVASGLVRSGKTVAVFTIDVNDCRAVAQLRAFCGAKDIPFALVHKNAFFQRFRLLYGNCDHILVDTYGFSAHDTAAVRRLSHRLAGIGAESMLVFPADTDGPPAGTLPADFRYRGAVLTKLDRAERPGRVYSVIEGLKLPVHFFATGPDVPTALEPATPERLVSLLFRLDESAEAAFESAAEGGSS